MGDSTQVGIKHQNSWRQMPAVKVSTKYDSEDNVFYNRLSTRVLNGLAKITGSIRRLPSGDFRYPILGVVTKYLSVHYDHEDRNTLVTLNTDVGRNLSVQYLRDIKAHQGEVKLQAHTVNQKYKTEISYDIPATALPKVVCTFPMGELRAEEVELDEERAIALSGFLAGSLLNGKACASYSDESATLKYAFKISSSTTGFAFWGIIVTMLMTIQDEELTLIPSISWPQLSPSLGFKRQFGRRNKLSYMHNFETTTWSAVYKYKPVEDFKLKLGYDSDIGICWSSFWLVTNSKDFGHRSVLPILLKRNGTRSWESELLRTQNRKQRLMVEIFGVCHDRMGKEDSGAKTAPRKCKLQVMLQVPQDDVKSGVLLFRLKKRWDLF